MISKSLFLRRTLQCSHNFYNYTAFRAYNKERTGNTYISKSEIPEYKKKAAEAAPKRSDDNSTIKVVEPKKVKFSSFMEKEKEYTYQPDRAPERADFDKKFPGYEPKEEFRKIPFDPNVRHRLPEMPNDLMYGFMNGYRPQAEAQSQYVAVNHKGTTYHLFDAKRMPVGRMAVLISQFIRGKNKPTYHTRGYEDGDKCIVVNMADPLLTGRKREQKIYRHHTGFPGGLKEFTFKHVIENNPERVLEEAVMGMLPKNKLRQDIVKKHITMFRGPYHTMQDVGLPQFTEPLPGNINEEFEVGPEQIVKNDHVVRFTSAPDGSVPEEFKDLRQDIDTSISEPIMWRKKTHTEDKQNLKLGNALKQSFREHKKFKTYKPKYKYKYDF